MEDQTFNITPEMTSRSSVVMDEISPNSTMNSFVLQSYLFDHHADDLHVTNLAGNLSSNPLISSYNRYFSRDTTSLGSGLSAISSSEFQEETPNSAGSVANYMAAKAAGLQENLNNLAISVPPIYSSEVLSHFVSNENTFNSRFPASLNRGQDDNRVLGFVTNQWDIHKYSAPLELIGKTSEFHQPYAPNGWIPPDNNDATLATVQSYGSSKFSNELSLTLATSQPSVITGMTILSQCSDMSRSAVPHNSLNSEKMLASERTSCDSEDLSLSFASCRPLQLSQLILGSRYLSAIQEILAQIASFSLENIDHSSYLMNSGSLAGSDTPFSSMSQMDSTSDGRLEGEMEPALQRRALEAKRAKLLALLQMVDERYNQCLDEIHTVVSAFHAATELDPQIHARFALHTLSLLYKNLRERISSHCLAMGATNFDSAGGTEKSFETSFIQKQWALQQLKKKDHQLWRPQRGLPERSVSVLRAWMFQNFLHP
ncbi:POX domain containing protein [Parasponia andersonii]|uniref:POX domain containing protein n=1 Tax=Parasponia andersonii TaxID=3476 RepID=A0A2P5DTS6_PARAD|nr:POX domain containing protein [Parasponia andersonii]